MRRQAKTQAGVSSEVEVLKVLKSILDNDQTEYETVCLATVVLNLCTCCVLYARFVCLCDWSFLCIFLNSCEKTGLYG